MTSVASKCRPSGTTLSRLGLGMLLLLWVLMAVWYVQTARHQNSVLNLSATAGGQYPYLVYASGLARNGQAPYLGDRNRMPLLPAMLSVFHDDDWETFVERAAWFSIVLSVLILIGIGGLAYASLPAWSATAFTIVAMSTVFIYKASFVQVELLYYGLLLVSWVLLCRVILRPSIAWAAAAGATLGLTFLAKASGAATLSAFLAASVVHLVLIIRPRRVTGENPADGTGGRGTDVLLSTVVVVFVSAAIAYPYLNHNRTRFGRYFYNVNSTFFMWCDSWSEAKAFADTYQISDRYPTDAPPERIPSPGNYWRRHSTQQIAQRAWNGLCALGHLAWHGPYAKYLLVVVVFCGAIGLKHYRQLRSIPLEGWIAALFCAMFFGGYLASYAWYAQIAYGDRFLISLFLPALFGAFWLCHRFDRPTRSARSLGRNFSGLSSLAIGITAAAVAEGVGVASKASVEPSETFIQFYYNESLELQRAGNLSEARRGFAGVVRLDPSVTAAHLNLGMIALAFGEFEEAVTSLSQAARLQPDDAEIQNSLGSALIQAGRVHEAIAAFRRATEASPTFAMAWYNLGGSYYQAGMTTEAESVRRRLETLDLSLAAQLAQLLSQ